MKLRFPRIFVGLTVVCLGVGVMAAEDAKKAETLSPGPRTWTSMQGQTIDATFVKLLSGTVYLKKTNGKTVPIGITRLSAEDQKLAKELAAAMKTRRKSGFAHSSAKKVMTGILNEEELKGLKSELILDEKTGKKLKFYASIGPRSLSKTYRRKYAKSGKVPFRVTAVLYEFSKKRGKQIQKMEKKGSARITLLDSDGEVVLNKTETLSKLCPS